MRDDQPRKVEINGDVCSTLREQCTSHVVLFQLYVGLNRELGCNPNGNTQVHQHICLTNLEPYLNKNVIICH